jgi:Flp pilus assembly protein TadG
MVELALVIPLLLVLLLGIIEGARLMFIYASVSAASQEAARYGSGVGNNGTGTALYNDCDGIRAAATRIGFFAGVTSSDVTISHDTGPDDTNPVTYCTGHTGSLSTQQLGNRIVVEIQVSYTPMVPIVLIPPIPMHTSNARTILFQVPVVAYTPVSIPGGQTCDVIPFKITSETDPTSSSGTNTITITNTGGATGISNIIVVWDPTSKPKLLSMTSPDGTVTAINGAGPMWNGDVSWSFPTGNTTFKLRFDQTLKNPMIIQLTLTNPSGCTFGR